MNIYQQTHAEIHVSKSIENLTGYSKTIAPLMMKGMTIPLVDYNLECIKILFDYGKVKAVFPEFWFEIHKSIVPTCVFEVLFCYPELDEMKLKLFWCVWPKDLKYYFDVDTFSSLREMPSGKIQDICRKHIDKFQWVKR
jgi:hypothetical protein